MKQSGEASEIENEMVEKEPRTEVQIQTVMQQLGVLQQQMSLLLQRQDAAEQDRPAGRGDSKPDVVFEQTEEVSLIQREQLHAREQKLKRLQDLPVRSWTTEDVRNWMYQLAGHPDWSRSSAQLVRCAKQVADLKVSGKVVENMDSDAWTELGLEDSLTRTRMVAELASRIDPLAARSARLQKGVKLRVAINVLSISAIDTVSQTFDCEFVLRCRTLNLRHQENSGDPILTMSGDMVNADNWEPRIRFMNLLATHKWNFHSSLRSDGEMDLKYSIHGTFSEPYELGYFPFDLQGLTLIMSSSIPYKTSTSKEGERKILEFQEMPKDLTAKPFVVQTQNFGASNVFEMGPHVEFATGHTSTEESTTGTVRPKLAIRMKVRRRSGAYVWNVILPLMLIDLMTLGTFAVPYTDVADRLSVSLTMVLTAVAFKLQIADSLPKLSYPTLIDWYVLASFFFIFSVVVQNVLMGLAQNEQDEDRDKDIDAITGFLFLALFGFIHAVAFAIFWYLNAQKKRELHDKRLNDGRGLATQFPSQIDGAAGPELGNKVYPEG